MVAIGVPGATPFGGHAGAVNCVAFSPDGATFVTGGDDGVVRLWDLAGREQVGQFVAARPGRRWDKRVWAVAFSPDGSRVAAGYDDALQVWDIADGGEQPLVDVRGQRIWSVAYSPDGTGIATASDDKTVRVWDTATGQERNRLTGHEGTVYAVAFRPDGNQLASGGEDGGIRIWEDDLSWEPGFWRVVADEREWSFGEGSKRAVRSLSYGPSGACLVAGSTDGVIRTWDYSPGEQSWKMRAELNAQQEGETLRRVWCVAYSPDGDTIAAAGDDGDVWRWARDGRPLPRFTGHTGTVSAIAYSPDGDTLVTVSGGDRTIRIWDARDGTERAKFTGHTGTVHLLAYSPDGTTIATGGEDRTVRVWDAATGTQTAQVSGHIRAVEAIAYSPDGGTLVTMDEGSVLHLWDMLARQERELDTGREQGAGVLAYGPDGAVIATAGRRGAVRLWDVATWRPAGELNVTDADDIAHVDALAFSPDGAAIAVTSTPWARSTGSVPEREQHSVRLYGMASRQPTGLATASDTETTCLAFSPDGGSVAFGDGDAVRIWNVKGERPTVTLAGHDGHVESVAYSPDGASLATAGCDETVRLWEAATGQQRGTLTGHTQDVRAVAYSPDGNTLASAGDDGTIRIWNPRNGEQVYGTGFRPARVSARALAGVRSDSPSTADMLGVEDDVQTLAELIAASETQPPLAIALIGDWGTGKSSLMLQVEGEVAALAVRARKNPGRSPFAENIRQVRFNAWHYSDDKLWAGLVSRLFEALRAPDDSGTVDASELAELTGQGLGDDGPQSALDEIRRLKDKRASLQQELETWQTDKRQVEADLLQASDSWSLLRASARRAVRRFRETVFPLLGWLAAIVVALVAWHYLGARVGSVTTVFAVAGGPVAFMSKVQSAHQETRGFANKLRAELEDDKREDARQIEAAQREIQETENQIYLIDAATWLQQFLDDRGAKSEYLRYQGLLGLVRADFEQLSEKLALARAQWARGGYVGAAPLERIVLYIDDLDRCPPHRVVEVLEAIHLMLALDLFVVVVAVDARWLIRSLEYHHRELFGTGGLRADGTSGGRGAGAGTGILNTGIMNTGGTNTGGAPVWDTRGARSYPGGGNWPDPGEGRWADDWTRPDQATDPGSALGWPDQRLATPIDYLDKIFQIPFALLPPSSDAAASYLRHLLPRPARAAESPFASLGSDTVNGPTADGRSLGSPQADRTSSFAGRADAEANRADAEAGRAAAEAGRPGSSHEPAGTTAGRDVAESGQADESAGPEPARGGTEAAWRGTERKSESGTEAADGERGETDERPDDPRSHPVEAAARGGVEAVELPPQQLQVSAAEVDFMARLGPLLPTPRAAKRLVNVYRLVRIGVRSADLAAFVGDERGGPYQAVQVLLAILVGHPEFARRVFSLVLETTGGESRDEDLRDRAFADLVAVVETAGRSGGHTPSFGIIHSVLADIRGDSPLSVRMDECRRWCPRLARFSFYTRDLAGRMTAAAAQAGNGTRS